MMFEVFHIFERKFINWFSRITDRRWCQQDVIQHLSFRRSYHLNNLKGGDFSPLVFGDKSLVTVGKLLQISGRKCEVGYNRMKNTDFLKYLILDPPPPGKSKNTKSGKNDQKLTHMPGLRRCYCQKRDFNQSLIRNTGVKFGPPKSGQIWTFWCFGHILQIWCKSGSGNYHFCMTIQMWHVESKIWLVPKIHRMQLIFWDINFSRETKFEWYYEIQILDKIGNFMNFLKNMKILKKHEIG